MDPYYLQMRPPGSSSTDFVMLQPFVPSSRDDSRKNLSAFMVARGDPANYGQLEAYVMPRQRPVDGPAIIDSRIQADAEVSREITFLGQQGSKVTFGNMLLVPIEQSLLWVRPLYVEAAGATPLPQLKRVILVYADRVVMADTLRQGLLMIFGESPPTLEQAASASNQPVSSGGGAGAGGAPTTAQPTLQELLGQAEARFTAAEDALRRGDLAGYQRETLAARDAIRRAQELAGGATTPTTRVGT
jgi:uncharacterized protein